MQGLTLLIIDSEDFLHRLELPSTVVVTFIWETSDVSLGVTLSMEMMTDVSIFIYSPSPECVSLSVVPHHHN